MKCTSCQAETSGAFCQNCGAPAEGATCASCQGTLLAGANFCTDCGVPVRPASSQAPWIVAGAAVVALIVVLFIPGLRPGGSAGGVGGGFGGGFDGAMGGEFGGGFGGTQQDQLGRAAPLTGTPREQADRLFNRVMQALSAGDLDQVNFFVPMAVLAYRQAGELDDDGLYHLSLLETVSGDPASGLATAEQILAESPNHILALAAAAQASDALGDSELAATHYQHLLTIFDEERERDLPEYLEHAQIFDAYREEAELFLQDRGQVSR